MYNPIIYFQPKKITFYFIKILLTLTILCLVGQFLKYYLGRPNIHGLVPLFDFNHESNIPTYYNTFLLVCNAILLLVIAYIKKTESNKYSRHWLGLSFIFLFLSIDEFAGIHEKFNYLPTRDTFQGLSSVFYYSWVIFYGAIIGFLILIYWKFLKNLVAKTRNLFVLSGLIYVSAALGIELFQSHLTSVYGEEVIFSISQPGLVVSLSTVVEEFLEMSACILFFYSLLDYIQLQWGDINFATSKSIQSDKKSS